MAQSIARRGIGARLPRWWVGVPLGAAGVLGNFGFSAVGPALPDITRALDVSAGAGAWVLVGYSLGVGISLPAGRLADQRGTRPVVGAAAAALLLGSLCAAAAPSFVVLVLARILQSFGTSALAVMCAVSITARVEPADRTAALAAYTAASSITIGCGALVGALVRDAVGWRGVFLLPLAALVGVALLWRRPVPGSRRGSEHLDLLTSVLTLVGVAAVLLVLTSGTTDLARSLTVALALLAVGVVAVLGIRSRRGLSDTLPPSLLSNRALWWLMTGAGSVFAVYLGQTYLLPLVVPSGTGVAAGLFWLPSAAAACAAVAIVTVRGPSSYRRLVTIGAAATAGGLLLAFAGETASLRMVALCLVVAAWATAQLFGLEWVPRLVAESERGVALGLFNFVFVASGSIGPAVAGVVLQASGATLAGVVVSVIGLSAVASAAVLARSGGRTASS